MLLDLPSLQTLVTAVELGGFGKAAERLHRTPGAVSLQIKALEERVGTPLFRKQGRQQVLTEAGELLLGHARRIIALNDEAVLSLQGARMQGSVRFGMPQDFADGWLPATLARFARAHPAVRIDIRVDRSSALLAQLQAGEMDLVLAFGESYSAQPGAQTGAQTIARLPTQWIAQPDLPLPPDASVPLLLLEQPCSFRQAAIAALERMGRPWHVVLTSASVSAIWAAAQAGLGVAPRATAQIPAGLAAVGKPLGLPALPSVGVSLHRDSVGAANPAVEHLQAVVREVAAGQLGQLGPGHGR